MKRRLLLAGVLALATSLLVACGGGAQQWKTTNITGVMPDLKFTLTDENGKAVHADAYRGKVKVMYFGYTHCPDICPLTLSTVGRAVSQLGDQADGVRVLFVSVDPKRDPPKVLKEYTQAFGPEFVGLTGTQDQLKALSKRYRVSYSYAEPDANGEYAVNHSSAVFVFDKNGDVRLLMNRSDGVDAMAHDLAQLINAS
ncbi:MAG TPA: SCO family protein [Gammaproteobacteria bacterium]|nr:SCO family protein [Gammaproteobacteria bacterium]